MPTKAPTAKAWDPNHNDDKDGQGQWQADDDIDAKAATARGHDQNIGLIAR